MTQNKRQIGRYKILSALGAGGMGEVFLAEDTGLDRKVAVKFLNETLSRDSDKLNRFIRAVKPKKRLKNWK